MDTGSILLFLWFQAGIIAVMALVLLALFALVIVTIVRNGSHTGVTKEIRPSSAANVAGQDRTEARPTPQPAPARHPNRERDPTLPGGQRMPDDVHPLEIDSRTGRITDPAQEDTSSILEREWQESRTVGRDD